MSIKHIYIYNILLRAAGVRSLQYQRTAARWRQKRSYDGAPRSVHGERTCQTGAHEIRCAATSVSFHQARGDKLGMEDFLDCRGCNSTLKCWGELQQIKHTQLVICQLCLLLKNIYVISKRGKEQGKYVNTLQERRRKMRRSLQPLEWGRKHCSGIWSLSFCPYLFATHQTTSVGAQETF